MAKVTANSTWANLGFETELSRAADALRSNIDAAEDKRDIRDRIELICSSIDRSAMPRRVS